MDISITQKNLESFIILRKNLSVILGDASNDVINCAAKLLEYFNNWADIQLRQRGSEWIRRKQFYLKDDVLKGEHSINIVRRSLKLLMRHKLLFRQRNPDDGDDQTLQYTVAKKTLNEKLKAYWHLLEERERFQVRIPVNWIDPEVDPETGEIINCYSKNILLKRQSQKCHNQSKMRRANVIIAGSNLITTIDKTVTSNNKLDLSLKEEKEQVITTTDNSTTIEEVAAANKNSIAVRETPAIDKNPTTVEETPAKESATTTVKNTQNRRLVAYWAWLKQIFLGKTSEPTHEGECSASSINPNNQNIKPVNDPFFPQQQAPRHDDLIYDGENTPWLLPPRRKRDVNFLPQFLDFFAQRWMAAYDKADIHQAKADFRSSLLNNPDRVAIRWDEYQDHILDHASKIKTRIEHGITPTDAEKRKMVTHLPIVAPNRVLTEAESNLSELNGANEGKDCKPDNKAVDEQNGVVEVAVNDCQVVEQPQETDLGDVWEEAQNNESVVIPEVAAAPEERAKIKGLIDAIAAKKAMAKSPFEEIARRKEERRIAKGNEKIKKWNSLLATGIPSIMKDAERLARAAGYEVIDNRVVPQE